jgi:hypothetical protein
VRDDDDSINNDNNGGGGGGGGDDDDDDDAVPPDGQLSGDRKREILRDRRGAREREGKQ